MNSPIRAIWCPHRRKAKQPDWSLVIQWQKVITGKIGWTWNTLRCVNNNEIAFFAPNNWDSLQSIVIRIYCAQWSFRQTRPSKGRITYENKNFLFDLMTLFNSISHVWKMIAMQNQQMVLMRTMSVFAPKLRHKERTFHKTERIFTLTPPQIHQQYQHIVISPAIPCLLNAC